MAVKLPAPLDYQSRQAPRPDTGVVSYRPISGAEGAQGEALSAVGRGVSHTGDQLFARYEVERQKQDTLRAEEAFNTLREQQLELTYGEKGFARKKGSEAVNGDLFKDYSAQIRDRMGIIESQLQTPQQKELFRRRANLAGLQFQEEVLRHVTGERKVYDKQVLDGTLAVETQMASRQWNAPNEIGASILRVQASINAYANEQGWSKEAREASLLAATGNIHKAVLGQMLATDNFEMAKKYYDTNRDALDPATAKQVEKAVQDGVEKQVSGQYRLAYVNTRNDMRGLTMLENAITKDPRLDDARRAALLGPIMSQRAMLERRADAAYNRQVRQVASSIAGINETTLAGYTPDQETLLRTYNAAKGTEMEADALGAIRLVEVTAKLKGLPPAARSAEIDKIEAAVRQNPQGDAAKGVRPKYDWKIVNQLRTLDRNMTEEARKNPYGFAVSQGLTEAAPVDWSDLGKSAPAIAQRFQIAAGMNAEYATPYKPLAPEEARQIKDILKTMPANKKAAWLGDLATASGVSEQGRRGYIGMMGQLAEDDPVTASAGYQAARKRYNVSEQILNGQALLNPPTKEDGKPAGGNLITMPSESSMRQQFDRVAPVEAYGRNMKARNIDFQAARAIYADLLSNSKTKDTGTLDSDMWDKAIETAAGRVARINGTQTILPPDMDTAEFRAGARARIGAAAAANRLPEGVNATRLNDLPLEPVAVGVYAVRSGDGYIIDQKKLERLIASGALPKKPTAEQMQKIPAQDLRLEINFNLPAPEGTETPTRRGSIRSTSVPWSDIDMSRPRLENPDGSFSTERTITIESDGKHLLIPTIVGGKERSAEEAIRLWRDGKNKAVGSYATAEQAEDEAKKRSVRIGKARGEK